MVVYLPARPAPAAAAGRAAGGGGPGAVPGQIFAIQRVDTSAVQVPPVGVEPTLGTLLGGRPLPLGYGGATRIPRRGRIIRGPGNGRRDIFSGVRICNSWKSAECGA